MLCIVFVQCDRRTYGGLTARARKIFMKPTMFRTEEDLVHLYEVVDRLMCFRRYSKKIKHRLASVITFDAYDNGRRIIKEGQPGKHARRAFNGDKILLSANGMYRSKSCTIRILPATIFKKKELDVLDIQT
jgi:hypothetical protein